MSCCKQCCWLLVKYVASTGACTRRLLALRAGLQTFLAERVEATILEVGLGGRLDATNVVRSPWAVGITPLGYDHMEVLGHTLGAIAREKAGILKPGCPAFTVPQEPEAMAVLKARLLCSLAPCLQLYLTHITL